MPATGARPGDRRRQLVEVFVAAIEQASPEQRARLRAALEVEPVSTTGETTPAVFTPATLAASSAASPRSIRGAIARGELDAVKRGRGWVIGADAVERWTATHPARSAAARRRAGERRAAGRWAGRSRVATIADRPYVDSPQRRRPGGAATPPARPEPD